MNKLPNLEDAAARYIMGTAAAQETKYNYYPADGIDRIIKALYEELRRALKHENM